MTSTANVPGKYIPEETVGAHEGAHRSQGCGACNMLLGAFETHGSTNGFRELSNLSKGSCHIWQYHHLGYRIGNCHMIRYGRMIHHQKLYLPPAAD